MSTNNNSRLPGERKRNHSNIEPFLHPKKRLLHRYSIDNDSTQVQDVASAVNDHPTNQQSVSVNNFPKNQQTASGVNDLPKNQEPVSALYDNLKLQIRNISQILQTDFSPDDKVELKRQESTDQIKHNLLVYLPIPPKLLRHMTKEISKPTNCENPNNNIQVSNASEDADKIFPHNYNAFCSFDLNFQFRKVSTPNDPEGLPELQFPESDEELEGTTNFPTAEAILSERFLLNLFKCCVSLNGFFCDFSTSNMDYFYKHMTMHLVDGGDSMKMTNLYCIYCLEQCASSAILCNHIILNHKKDAYQCPICPYRSGPWQTFNHLRHEHATDEETPVLVTLHGDLNNDNILQEAVTAREFKINTCFNFNDKYICLYCEVSTLSISEMLEHLREDHPDGLLYAFTQREFVMAPKSNRIIGSKKKLTNLIDEPQQNYFKRCQFSWTELNNYPIE